MKRIVSIGLAWAVVAAACGGSSDPDQADARTIDVFGPYLGREADAFADSLRGFEHDTGIEVRYTGSANFVDDLRSRVNGLDLPDVAMVPQPAVIEELVDSDAIVPLDEATAESVADNFDVGAHEIAVDGEPYVVPYRSTVKSIVWYRPEIFEQYGWVIPDTFDELVALVEQIEVESELAPWCFSIFSGSATGWPATDWIEDLVLRRAGADVYDEWVDGERPFADAEIMAAFEEFNDLVVASGRTAGGLRAILNVETANTNAPLFEDPAGCALYKQASFAESWFPDDVDVGADEEVDFFILPGIEAGRPAPLVTGGDGAVQFDARDDVDRLMTYLSTPDGAEIWAGRGGFVSTRSTVDPDSYYRGADRRVAGLLLEDRVTRFDASDVMPAAIGSDLLWQQITAWIAGSLTLDELVQSVDAARAAL